MTHVALVGDVNSTAYNRLNVDLNFAGYPSVFYDGGDTVGVGGTSSESFYRDRIEAVGSRVVPDMDLLIKMTHLGGTNYEIYVKIGNGSAANYGPAIPDLISPPSEARKLEAASFSSSTVDPENDDLFYQFDFDEGTSGWIGPITSGDTCTAEYAWFNEGVFDVRVRTKDIWGTTTDWSQIHTITVGCCVGDRGNIDGGPDDGTLINSVDIADLVALVAFMFQGGATPVCIEEADIDGSGGELAIDISDMVALVAYMFQGGPAPISCP